MDQLSEKGSSSNPEAGHDPTGQITDPVQRLAETEAAIRALTAGQVDAGPDPAGATPVLLRQAQAALQESEARYRRLLARMSAVVFEMAPDGRLLFVNEAVTSITGYQPEELQGHNWQDLPLLETQSQHAQELIRLLEWGDLTAYELMLTARDGTPITLELNTANHYGPDGILQRIVGIGIDRTRRRQAEAERDKALHDLGKRVKELTFLQHVIHILQDRHKSLDRTLEEIVACLPEAWQYPPITGARITLGGQEFATPNFAHTPWMQRATFTAHQGEHGSIEVCYLAQRPPQADGPFLAEERRTLDTLADMLELHLEHLETEAAWRRSVQELEIRVQERTAELIQANEELQVFNEELEIIEDELRTQNQALAAAHDALEAERRRYQELFEFAPDGYLVTDARGVIRQANRAAADLLGMPQGFLVGKPLDRYLARENHTTFASQLRQFSEEEQVSRLISEVSLQPRTRDVFPAAMTLAPIRDAQGQLVGLRCLLRDITERVRLQAERERLLVQASQDREAILELAGDLARERDVLGAIMENTGTCLAYLDPQFNFVRVNSAYADGSGHSQEELIGSNHFELFPNAENQAIFEQVRDTGRPVEFRAKPFEYADQPERGVTYWDWTLAPIKDEAGHVQGLVLSLLDVTGQERAKRALRESEARYRRLFNSMTEGFAVHEIVCDPEGKPCDYRFLEVNPAFEALTGLKQAGVLGKTVLELMPDTEPFWIETYGRVALTGEPVHFEQFSAVLGRTYEVFAYCPAEKQFACLFLDITQRKQDEAALRAALEESRQRQAEVSGLLEGARAVLAHREFEDTARSIFSACKNLVGGQAGYIALLSQDGTQNELVYLDSGELPCTVDPALPMPVRGLRERAYRTGQTVYDNHFSASEWTQFLPEGHAGLDNVLFAPLVITGITVGLLGLANKPGGFTDNDARLASAFAELAAISLFNSRALQSLENSEERFRSVAQTANEAIITVDSQARIVFWNQAAQTMFGYRADEAVGRPFTLIIPERFHAGPAEAMGRAFTLGKSEAIGRLVEATGLRKDGSEFPIEHSFAAWRTREGTFFTGVIHDITDRWQAEQALRESERKLKILFEILPVGVSILDAELKITYMNPALGRILDISEEKLMAGNYRARTYLRPDGTPMPAEEFASARAIREQREVHDVETGVVKEDGTVIWTNVSAVPVAFPDWKVVIVTADITERVRAESQKEAAIEALHLAHDELEVRVKERTSELAKANAKLQAEVAERRRAEAALHLERNRLKSILDGMENGVWIASQQYDIEYVNPVTERDFGPAIGRKCYAYFHGLTDVCPWCRNQEVFDGKIVKREWHSLKTGKTYDLVDTPLRNADGSVSKMEIMHDITQRKQVEEELRSSEERFRQLAENVREVFWITDPARSQMLYVSPAYEEIWGRSCQSLYEQADSYLDAVHAEDRERVIASLPRQVVGGYDEHYRIVRPDESVRWIRARAFPVRNEQGQVYRIAGISEDVTERALAFQILEQRVEERTRELSTLLEASRHLASTLDMERLLEMILDQIKAIVDCSGATIYKMVGDELTALAHRGPITSRELLDLHYSVRGMPAFEEAIRRQAPVIIPDVHGDTPLARLFQEKTGEQLHTTLRHIRSWMGVPLLIQERPIGMLGLHHNQPNYYTRQHAELTMTFANQAAMALENARLYEQARELAAMQERQRLARDLHDSVSQTLFSASLSAGVFPRLWERDPEAGRLCLKELQQLTRGALAEMRTLLLELRPSGLIEVEFGDLLAQLAEAITSRTRVPVALNVEGHRPLPPDVQVTLYRIAQEALNNVAKHAGASKVEVSLRYLSPGPSPTRGGEFDHPSPLRGGEGGEVRGVELRIADDGQGFDPQDVLPQHLGLGIMRERAEAIGATFEIQSQVGQGTRIRVVWNEEDE